MDIKRKLPVSYLLFTSKGRVPRAPFWFGTVFLWCMFYLLFTAIEAGFGEGTRAILVLHPLFFYSSICLAVKRLHDSNLSGKWLYTALIPLLGPLFLIFMLFLKGGTKRENRFGPMPGTQVGYFKNPDAETIEHLKTDERIVNDVTRLNPVIVQKVVQPGNIEEIQAILKNDEATKVSVGGGRFSMGGQTASAGSLHIDMRALNSILAFSAKERTIKVQAGVRWCDIQEHIDRHHLSVKIMQTYANFTVGGSLSVNAHGRYMGAGPVILSVRAIEVVLASGELMTATPEENPELFYGTIGCYNGLGIIVTATLELATNVAVEQVNKKISRGDYYKNFQGDTGGDKDIVFHNADIYPPHYEKVRSVSWRKTEKKPTTKTRLMPLQESYPIHRYFLWSFSETPFGKWQREHVIEPFLYIKKKIHWRNYEAGYDVAELEPGSRKDSTYVLQEYFVPVEQGELFHKAISEIFIRHNLNIINVSIRHAGADPGSYLAWARKDSFAYVVYYKQRATAAAKSSVGVWTREIIDAVVNLGGCYYLPYQTLATSEQFHAAYPRARDLFALKEKYDPENRFRNVLWNTYYKPAETKTVAGGGSSSEFLEVFKDSKYSDAFYKFLQVIFHLYPEDEFHSLISEACKEHYSDEKIYEAVQEKLPKIKPFLSELTLALPALIKQKKEMLRQTLELLKDRREFNGYVEIGTTGRYIGKLRKKLKLSGETFLVNDFAPSNSLNDIFERGGLRKIGRFSPMNNYEPISAADIGDDSIDLVTCYIGLHHCPVEKREEFIHSIYRILRPGGWFVLRDHDVHDAQMHAFVSLVHTVFNLGLGETWETDLKDYKKFQSIEQWSRQLASHGLVDSNERLLQDNDPSDNTLVLFTKKGAA